MGPLGQMISRTTTDIASGITLFSDSYSNYDSFSRPQRVTHLDGTYEDTQYACCGVDTTTDRDGAVTQHWYDAAKRPTAQTQVNFNITTTNILDAAGRVLRTLRIGSDGSSNVLRSVTYNLAGDLVAETNALGGVTTYVESTDQQTGGRIRTTTQPNGGTIIEAYYVDGSLKQVTGTAAQPVRYEYGMEDNGASPDYAYAYTLEVKLDANGNDTGEWTKSYTDVMGRNYKTIYADATPNDVTDNPYTRSWHNDAGQLWKQRDPDGVVTLNQYNGKGELEYTAVDLDRDDVIDFSGTDRITRSTNWVGAATAAAGVNVRRSQGYTWITDNQNTSLCVVTNESSTDGLRSWSFTLAGTNQSRTVFAGSGNRYATNTAPDGSFTVAAYSYGRLSSVTRKDAAGTQLGQTTYGYDPQGRQSTVTDARNGATTYGYHPLADLMQTVTTPNPGTSGGTPQMTTTYYDTSLRAWKVMQPDGASVTNVFFASGMLQKTYGSRTYPVEYTYDTQGRMKTMKTWTNFASNLGAAITTWNYDTARGWLTNKAYADATGPFYTYTDAGRLETRKWARTVSGQPLVTTYSYNNAGDLSGVDYSDTTPDVTYTYDRRGRQATLGSGGMTTTLSNNDANQLLSEAYSGGTLSGLTVTNGYDAQLRRSAVGLNTQPSTLTQYGYDGASRLQNVTNGNARAAFSYLANSPLVGQIGFTNSGVGRMTTTKQYDFLNRLSSISSVSSIPSVVSFAYTYNSANQRTRATLGDGSYWVYDYDSLGQVESGKRYWYDGTPVAGQQFEYGFDDIGNRTQTKAGGDETGANLRAASYTNNTLNQITGRGVPGYVDVLGAALATNSVTVNTQATYRKGEYFRKELAVGNGLSALWTNLTVSSGGTNVSGNRFVAKAAEGFGYDADGNLTNDGRWVFTWDAENRLKQVESLASGPTSSKRKVVWEFDARGRRIRQTTYDGSSGSYVVAEDLKFLSDGWRHIVELNATNNALVRSYVWGLDLSGSMDGAGGVGGLLIVNSAANGAQFCAYDGNGNVTALVKASDGTETARYEYGPFGEAIRATGAMAKDNPFRFSTKRTDNATDFVLYEYRLYSPSSGRWPNRDPIGERGGKNIYGFVGNDPISRFDRLGLAYGNPVSGPNGPVGPSTWSCPRTCGPDYTAAVNAEIAKLRSYLSGLPKFPIDPGSVEIGWPPTPDDIARQQQIESYLRQFYDWFKQVALSLDYDAQAKNTPSGNILSGCPSPGCFGTVTLCGKCVGSDTPGNVMFGFLAAATGVRDSIRNLGARMAEAGDKDGERDGVSGWIFGDDDADVFPFGKELFNSGSSDICTVLSKLPQHVNSTCAPCSKTGSFKNSGQFQNIPYPKY